MILDRLADLRILAESASDATETLNDDVAFAEIEQQVNMGLSFWAELGVGHSRSLQRLTDAERRPVIAVASGMRQVLEDIGKTTDEELVTLASTTAEKRGRLLAVSRQARALRGELLSAQQALLRRLAGDVWPEEDLLRLDLIAHRSDNLTAAETAHHAMDVHERLMARIDEVDVGLPASEIDALIDEAEKAAIDAEVLRAESIDDEILRFWQAAFSEDGVPLTMLTPDILAWLEAHAALDSFRVRRTR